MAKSADTVQNARDAYEREKVEVFIPKSNSGDDSDVIVSVNDKHWVAQRGKRVRMPRYAARILLNSVRAEERAEAYIRKVTGG